MADIAVTCFGPGLPARGQRAWVRFDDGTLVLDLGQGRERRISVSDISVSAGGFDGRQMLLSWPGGGSLVPADAIAVGELAANAPLELRPEFERWRQDARAARRGMGRTWAILGLILASPLFLMLLFWWQSERIAGWTAERIPLSVERRLGELAFAQFKVDGALIEEGSAVRAIREIGGRLTAGSAYDYKWYVSADPTVNAFAVPGGYVVVHSGLLQAADSAEEVAGVLAHEVQHVERRHSLKGMVHALGWQAMLSLVLGDVSGSVWGSMAYELGRLRFGREQETEADLKGLAALRRAGIDPRGMPSFFEKMAAREKDMQIAFLSTHPLSKERLAALQQAIKDHGDRPSAPLPYDWAQIRVELTALSESKGAARQTGKERASDTGR